MFMSNQLSLIAQASNNSCNSLTEGAINKMSFFSDTTQDVTIVTMLKRDIDIGILSVRPSVRHVPVFYRNDLTYCHSFFLTLAQSF